MPTLCWLCAPPAVHTDCVRERPCMHARQLAAAGRQQHPLCGAGAVHGVVAGCAWCTRTRMLAHDARAADAAKRERMHGLPAAGRASRACGRVCRVLKNQHAPCMCTLLVCGKVQRGRRAGTAHASGGGACAHRRPWYWWQGQRLVRGRGPGSLGRCSAAVHACVCRLAADPCHCHCRVTQRHIRVVAVSALVQPR